MTARCSISRYAALLAIVAGLAGCGPKTPDALVASAKEYLAQSDRNAAVIQLKTALQKDPAYAEARFLLGKTLLETGDLASAEKELRKAAELKYPSDLVTPALARAALFRGAFRNVVDEFAKAEVTSPQSKADLQSSVGQAWLALGNVDAARDAFAAAQAAIPGYPPALLGDARIKVSHGDVAGANALIEGALAKTPDLVDAWQFKGDLARAQGLREDALAAYRKALEIRPTYLPAHSRIVSVLLQEGKNAEAGKQLEAMKKIAPKHPQTYYLQALLDFREKRYPAAREAIQQQLRAWPDNAPGLLLSANIDYELGSFAQAEATLQKVLQRAPTHKFARMMLVYTYIRSGQTARANDALRLLLEAGEEDSDILALAGEVFMRNGDSTRAARYFARASALDPKSSGKRTALALSRVAVGDNEQALHELQEAAAADSGTRADLALIAVSASQGRYDVALDAIAALEKKRPGVALPHDLRGSVLAAKGDPAGARKSFEQAAALEPADFTAASGLAKLDLADRNPAEAKKRFDVVLAKDPKNAMALLAVADLRAQTGGAPDEVVALIGKAVSADPTNPTPRLALISYYMNVKQPNKAVAAAQDALAVMPDRAELLYAAGQAQQAAGESNQAAKSYNKLAQVRPGSPLPYLKEAEAQIASKQYEAALQSLNKALEVKPDLLDAQRGLIAVYMSMDRVDDALGVARSVQKQRPSESIGYLLEGDIYASKKQWTDAVNVYRKGLSRVANTDLAERTLVALRAGGKASEADNFGSAWIKDHPKDTHFRGFLAETAVLRGDFATAVQQYKLMLELKPNDPLALNNLAWASGQLKDPKALAYAEKADQLAPNNPAILDTLGVLRVDNGEMKKGIESLQRAVALAPDASGIRLNLARALVKDGQKEAAKKELEILAKLGDKFTAQAEVTKLMQGL